MNEPSATKSTPGPWQIERWNDDGANEFSDGAFAIVVGKMGEAGYAVVTGRSAWNHRADESLANARLIAAAPELLQLAERVAEHFRDTTSPIGETARQLANRVAGQSAMALIGWAR